MFHIMIQSFEGHRFTKDTAGMGWRRREVWSTFAVEDSLTIATLTKFELEAGGVRTIIVPDHQYEQWCQWHKVA